MNEGVIVAADRMIEWLIPWWWMNYSLNNNFPVTFINFGTITPSMVQWCEERGVIEDFCPPSQFNVIGKEERQLTWLKKPFAMLQSKYDRTIWFDLDCWIQDSVKDLFATCENEAGLGIVKEPEKYQKINLEKGLIKDNEVMYNAGVIAYKKGSRMMKLWTEELLNHQDRYYADQDALSHLLSTTNIPFTRIDPSYNWIPVERENLDAKVIHLVGGGNKLFIKTQIMFLKSNLQVHFP